MVDMIPRAPDTHICTLLGAVPLEIETVERMEFPLAL